MPGGRHPVDFTIAKLLARIARKRARAGMVVSLSWSHLIGYEKR